MSDKKKDMDVERLCCMSDCLCKWVEKEIDCGMAGADIEKLGEVVDMIKDFAEAKYYCAQAEEKEIKKKYYCVLTEKMLEEPREEDMEMQYADGPWGYDNYRYQSSGKFAPKGHGTRYGYSRGQKGNTNGTTMDRGGNGDRSYPMGYPESRIPMNYNDPMSPYYGMEYVNGPWGHHESDYQGDMSMTPEEKMHHTMDNMKEMWKNADPNLKKEMKSDMTKLLNDVPV